MKFTNKHNIPEEIISSIVSPKWYDKGDCDISATGLLQPPRIRILSEQHKSQITQDYSDRVWMLLGSAVHAILENSNQGTENKITEERMYAEVDGVKIGGQTDSICLKDSIVKDYKVTSVYAVKDCIKNGKIEWEQQLNIYAYLYSLNYDVDVSGLNIIAICRDWNKSGLLRDRDYPKCPIVTIDINLWDKEKQLDFIKERVAIHEDADLLYMMSTSTGDLILPECTDQETWKRDDVWAVKKKNRKTALRLLSSKEKAHTYIAEELGQQSDEMDLYIEHRKGEYVRCKSYCPVSDFCNQYKESIGEI